MKLQDTQGNWYINTTPYSLIKKQGVDVYIIPAKDEAHADRLLEVARSIINGDFA